MSLPQIIEGLKRHEAYPHGVQRIEVIETHISYVVLTGDYAYKIKKNVRLPFVDFSTLALRRHYCERELALNRRTAADLYLEVVPIGGSLEVPIVGRTPALEFAVKMREFGPRDTAEHMLERDELTGPALMRLAAGLAEFHGGLEPARGESPMERMHENLKELAGQLSDPGGGPVSATAEPTEQEIIARIRQWLSDHEAKLLDLFHRRERGGSVRDCHGDLHLGNIAAIGGRLVPFDCLEFDDGLRIIDVADETAFLVMDLEAHGRGDLAHLFLNAYLQESGDYEGLAVAGFYRIHRALVRAKVRMLAAATEDTSPANSRGPFLPLALRLADSEPPLLTLTMGLSGSGKTTLTEPLIPLLPAVRVRSDIERKRLHGLESLAASDSGVRSGIYDERADQRTYDRLYQAASAAITGGIHIIIDATFLKREQRRRFAELASARGARFAILRCRAPAEVLRRRIEQRRRANNDASEADIAVLEAQLEAVETLDAAESKHSIDIDTTRDEPPEELARRLLHRAGH